MFVSHDRYFIKKIAKRICEIKNKGLYCYNGNYEYYKNELSKQQAKSQQQGKTNDTAKAKVKKKSDDTIHENNIAKLNKKISAMEAEIESIEEILDELNSEMHKHGDNLSRLIELEENANNLKGELGKKIIAWEKLTKDLEELQ